MTHHLDQVRERLIEDAASKFRKVGYSAAPMIVYRDPIKVGLTIAFLNVAKIDTREQFDEHLDWCVIGTRTNEDNQKIRNGVDNLHKCLTQELNG
jgi:hypothetical protein